MKVKLSLLLLVLLMCGCSSYWYQEGKTFDECKQARAECRAEMLKRSDLKNVTVQYEVEFIKNCMMEKGYELVSQGDLPLDVKREEAETSLHWRARGVAGTLE